MSAIDYGVPATARALACPDCGTEFVVGSRYCHVCGTERSLSGESQHSAFGWLDLGRVREAVGLPVASLVCFVLGVACVIAALVTGLIYSATTVLDWQAVQIWRIEWLLAATVALVAGILFKRSDTR